METVRLLVGIEEVVNGRYQDFRRPVSFVGEKVAETSWLTGRDDTRGVNQTLYRTEDGRLVVHVERWSRWQGEPSRSYLVEVKPGDLDTGGDFEELGRAAGLARDLTLNEALALGEP